MFYIKKLITKSAEKDRQDYKNYCMKNKQFFRFFFFFASTNIIFAYISNKNYFEKNYKDITSIMKFLAQSYTMRFSP